MSIFVAIIGLAFLILIHEAGHFFTRARGRHAAAQVLHRLSARRSCACGDAGSSTGSARFRSAAT